MDSDYNIDKNTTLFPKFHHILIKMDGISIKNSSFASTNSTCNGRKQRFE